ncbi:MAG: ester cyclase [Thermodesulfobacteriota bacterium]
MNLQENKVLTKRAFEEVWNNGNLDIVDEIYNLDFVDKQHHHPDDDIPMKGSEIFKKFARELLEAFPDHHAVIHDQIAEGDKVALRYESRATHKGKFWGVEPTNYKITWTGTVIYQITSGKISNVWVNWDMMGIMNQLKS